MYDTWIFICKILLSRENRICGWLPYVLIEIHKGTLLIEIIQKKMCIKQSEVSI